MSVSVRINAQEGAEGQTAAECLECWRTEPGAEPELQDE